MIQQLTKTQNKIAADVARGYSEKEIADRNCVSTHTVHAHLANIRKKLMVRSVVDITRVFILSLEEPKKFFTVLVLTGIQALTIVGGLDVDMRRQARTHSKVVKVSRKQN